MVNLLPHEEPQKTTPFYVGDRIGGTIRLGPNDTVIIELHAKYAPLVQNLISAELATISIQSQI